MNAPVLWTAAEAAAATGGDVSGDWTATGVSIDSRTAAPGDLFIAIAGPHFDGHDYVAAALAAGCAAAMVARRPDELPADAPLLSVDDCTAGLEALAVAARARTDCRVAGVTGSVGKTGVKEALATVLREQAPTHATTGNLNNQLGVPLTLARMPRNTVYAIIEMGMSQPGEIGPLSRLVRPDVAIITTIAAAHLEFFESVARIAEAKAEIFEGLAGGTAVLHRDNPFFPDLAVAAEAAGAARVVGFGAHGEATARLIDLISGPACSRIHARIHKLELRYRVGLPGRHWAMNSLAVLAAVDALGANVGLAAAGLARLTPPKGRGQRSRVALGAGSFEIIDDSYNASPAAMRAALETLAMAEPRNGGRRIAVLGDMLELGANSDRLHAGLAAAAGADGIACVYTAGPHMAHLHDALPDHVHRFHGPDSAALAARVAAEIRPGDVVMVKGSLGSRMAVVVEALTKLANAARGTAHGAKREGTNDAV